MIVERLKQYLQDAGFTDINIERHRPLSSLCTLGTGGKADVFIEPDSAEAAQAVFKAVFNEIKISPETVYVIGGGSNLIFNDGIISGVVISTKKLNKIYWRSSLSAEIQAGYNLMSLTRLLPEKNLGGLEFAAGIPGTIGGAIFGNAGAGGYGVCDLLEEVTTIEPDGEFRIWPRGSFGFSYRECQLADKKRLILSCKMTFREKRSSDREEFESFSERRKNQPRNFRSAGCTFKNPEGKSAGMLLDECGCKGLAVGGAIVSEQHANFILNRGNASSSDIFELARMCRKRVYDSTGILLEPEIKFAGFSNSELCAG